MTAARYFDGRTARAHQVSVTASGGWLRLRGDGDLASDHLIGDLAPPSAVPGAGLRIELPGGAVLEIDQPGDLGEALRAAGWRRGGVARAERSWTAALLALIALLAIGWVGYRHGLPAASDVIARHLPAQVDTMLGDQMWPLLEASVFRPSRLTPERQQAIRARFDAIAPAHGVEGGVAGGSRLDFRGSQVGPNAFALPGGRIVLTDELVALAPSDEAILGVLAHELGHLHHRHALRAALQTAAVGALVSLWLGDLGALAVNASASIATLAYSRDLEREADDFALAALARAGIPSAPLADLFAVLEHGQPHAPGFLSSHPASAERIARLRGNRP